MKKLLSSIFLFTALCLCLTACSDDDEESGRVSTNPEQETAGTYVGTWTRELSGGETVTGQGTLTFVAATSYVTTVTATCTDLSLDLESVANIVLAGDNYAFSNMLATNGFGATFSGEITQESQASISFTKTVKEGRKSYVYNYSFTGTKQ